LKNEIEILFGNMILKMLPRVEIESVLDLSAKLQICLIGFAGIFRFLIYVSNP